MDRMFIQELKTVFYVSGVKFDFQGLVCHDHTKDCFPRVCHLLYSVLNCFFGSRVAKMCSQQLNNHLLSGSRAAGGAALHAYRCFPLRSLLDSSPPEALGTAAHPTSQKRVVLTRNLSLLTGFLNQHKWGRAHGLLLEQESKGLFCAALGAGLQECAAQLNSKAGLGIGKEIKPSSKTMASWRLVGLCFLL